MASKFFEHQEQCLIDTQFETKLILLRNDNSNNFFTLIIDPIFRDLYTFAVRYWNLSSF